MDCRRMPIYLFSGLLWYCVGRIMRVSGRGKYPPNGGVPGTQVGERAGRYVPSGGPRSLLGRGWRQNSGIAAPYGR